MRVPFKRGKEGQGIEEATTETKELLLPDLVNLGNAQVWTFWADCLYSDGPLELGANCISVPGVSSDLASGMVRSRGVLGALQWKRG